MILDATYDEFVNSWPPKLIDRIKECGSVVIRVLFESKRNYIFCARPGPEVETPVLSLSVCVCVCEVDESGVPSRRRIYEDLKPEEDVDGTMLCTIPSGGCLVICLVVKSNSSGH